MPNMKAYYRPQTIDEALQLLTRPNSAVLAGGTQLIATTSEQLEEVVDLQAVGLNHISVAPHTLTVSAMVRLQTLVEHPDVPELVRQMAQREGPNTFRHAGTIGGVVATADWESELYAALLVHETAVTLQTLSGTHILPLSDIRPDTLKGGVITAVTLQTDGQTAHARVARTPADKPIVAVVGRKDDSGTLRVGVCGVAERPILVTPDTIAQLNPPTNFRGSGEYRQHMAIVLSQRVMNQLNLTQSR